jgi:hypothetical protein
MGRSQGTLGVVYVLLMLVQYIFNLGVVYVLLMLVQYIYNSGAVYILLVLVQYIYDCFRVRPRIVMPVFPLDCQLCIIHFRVWVGGCAKTWVPWLRHITKCLLPPVHT